MVIFHGYLSLPEGNLRAHRVRDYMDHLVVLLNCWENCGVALLTDQHLFYDEVVAWLLHGGQLWPSYHRGSWKTPGGTWAHRDLHSKNYIAHESP